MTVDIFELSSTNSVLLQSVSNDLGYDRLPSCTSTLDPYRLLIGWTRTMGLKWIVFCLMHMKYISCQIRKWWRKTTPNKEMMNNGYTIKAVTRWCLTSWGTYIHEDLQRSTVYYVLRTITSWFWPHEELVYSYDMHTFVFHKIPVLVI